MTRAGSAAVLFGFLLAGAVLLLVWHMRQAPPPDGRVVRRPRSAGQKIYRSSNGTTPVPGATVRLTLEDAEEADDFHWTLAEERKP